MFSQVVQTSLLENQDEVYFSATLEWARSEASARLEQGQYLTWETFREHAVSCGVSEAKARLWFEESVDWRITYKGVTTYAGAAHFQFVAYKKVLASLLPLVMNRPMGQVRSLDERLNRQGYLRLMTAEPLVVHMGNTPPSFAKPHPRQRRSLTRLLRHYPPLRKFLLWLYHRIFEWYYLDT
jgi:hypothetical protein